MTGTLFPEAPFEKGARPPHPKRSPRRLAPSVRGRFNPACGTVSRIMG